MAILLTLVGIAALVGTAFMLLAVSLRSSNDTSGVPSQDELVIIQNPTFGQARLDIDLHTWLDSPPSTEFPEEGDSAVREMKTMGLHCVVVEQLPLFDHFAMFSDAGDRYVKAHVQQQAARLQAQLGDTASRNERGAAVWHDEWTPSWPDRDWCLAELGGKHVGQDQTP